VFSLSDTLNSHVWTQIGFYLEYVMQQTMFQPKGGMGRIGDAFEKVGRLIRLNSRVTEIRQNEKGVAADWVDTRTGQKGTASADYMVCTIPAGVLAQIHSGERGQAGGDQGAALCLFGEDRAGDEDPVLGKKYHIYGGHSFTDQSISLVSYPSTGFFGQGPAVLLGSYPFGLGAYMLAGMTPEQHRTGAEAGQRVPPEEYRAEFLNGVSLAWSRQPWIMGCAGWTEESRAQHYQNLASFDGRIVLAGEHVSYYNCWQEGAVASALDAITQLHQRALAGWWGQPDQNGSNASRSASGGAPGTSAPRSSRKCGG
jgi:monoamine oxidase